MRRMSKRLRVGPAGICPFTVVLTSRVRSVREATRRWFQTYSVLEKAASGGRGRGRLARGWGSGEAWREQRAGVAAMTVRDTTMWPHVTVHTPNPLDAQHQCAP